MLLWIISSINLATILWNTITITILINSHWISTLTGTSSLTIDHSLN